MNIGKVQISIIIPIYNSQDYLAQCLNSVISQSFEYWECLLVDDGSFDKSKDICDSFLKKDNRFKYFYQKNSGVSAARNVGIRNAKGDYIVFVDSDDTIGPKHLESFCVFFDKYPDIIVGNHFNSEVQIVDRKFYDYMYHVEVIWISCYKKALMLKNKIEFDEKLSHGEDSLFVLKFFEKCHTACYVMQHYNYAEGHVGGLNQKFQDLLVEEYVYDEIHKVLKRLNEKFRSTNEIYRWGQLNRLIKCMYQDQNYQKRSKRIAYLKYISNKYEIQKMDISRIRKFECLEVVLLRLGLFNIFNLLFLLSLKYRKYK